MKRNALLVTVLVLCAGFAAGASEQWVSDSYIRDGVVSIAGSAKLAVRSGPGTNFPQVGALSAGEKVRIAARQPGWVRIESSVAAPAVWVNAQYVKDGAVSLGAAGAVLAVRSGPGASFSVVGRLPNSRKVTVLGEKNGWLEISLEPQDFVAAMPSPAVKAAAEQSGEVLFMTVSAAAQPPTEEESKAVAPAPAPAGGIWEGLFFSISILATAVAVALYFSRPKVQVFDDPEISDETVGLLVAKLEALCGIKAAGVIAIGEKKN